MNHIILLVLLATAFAYIDGQAIPLPLYFNNLLKHGFW